MSDINNPATLRPEGHEEEGMTSSAEDGVYSRDQTTDDIVLATLPIRPSRAGQRGISSASASGSGSGSGSGDLDDKTIGTSSSEIEAPTGTAADATGRPHSTHSAPSHSPATRDRRRSRRAFLFLIRWARGPDPPVELDIKHYKWWPMAKVEAGWITLTTPVAWTDPEVWESRQQLQDANALETEARDIQARGGSTWDSTREPTRWRRPQWLRRGLSSQMQAEADVEHATTAEQLSRRRGSSSVDTPLLGSSHPARQWRHAWALEWRLNRLHWLLLFVVNLAWILGFVYIVKDIWYDASVTDTSTSPASTAEATFYGCTTTYWELNDDCGLQGEDCLPFSSNSSVAFRCPAGCAGTVLGSARAVGDELPDWVPLVVGGGGDPVTGDASESSAMYRGDSWVCAAAIHAGVIESDTGGCGLMWLTGVYSNYTSSTAHGLTSTAFESTFPVSYYFSKTTSTSRCQDRRDKLYTLDVVLSAFVGYVLQPKPIVWLFQLTSMGFFHINYASEPREFPPDAEDPIADFLPALFTVYALWRLVFRFLWATKPVPGVTKAAARRKMPLEWTTYTLAAWWIGTLLDVVFANVPLQRLVWSDITSEPGALVSLIVIIVVVGVLALNQVRVIAKTGYLAKYLTWTITGVIIIALLTAVPGMQLRLHHYIIALVLIPYTNFETRLSLCYAAFLLGMFLNGIGRWGWDGLIQDTSAVSGDSATGTSLPTFTTATDSANTTWSGVDATTNVGNITWSSIPSHLAQTYTGFNLLVDDVLLLSSAETSFDLGTSLLDYYTTSNANLNLTYYPGGDSAEVINQTIWEQPHYLRLAYLDQTGSSGDFTKAATAYFNGTWVQPDEGAT